jgi:hypothetical protein
MLRVFKAVSFCVAFFSLLSLLISAPAQAQCLNPVGTAGEMIYNQTQKLFQGCTATGWVAFNGLAYPANCPLAGNTCSDGTIYAGLSPDGNGPMYAMPTDSPAPQSWNNGTISWLDTPMGSCPSSASNVAACRTGRSHTDMLAQLVHVSAPYNAAKYCYDLVYAGYDDWYLPAQNELKLLYDMHLQVPPKGGFAASRYWSSSENNGDDARSINFSDGVYNNAQRNASYPVRCVRRY